MGREIPGMRRRTGLAVLQLGPYPPPHGGVQTNLLAIRDKLRTRGVKSPIINLHRHRSSRDEDVYHPTTALQTMRLLGGLRCDIIHLHIGGNVPARLAGLALACTAVPGRRSVLSFHSGGYPSTAEGRNASPWTVRGFIFRRFDRIIGVNQDIIDMFLRFGVPAERLRLILPNPVPARTQGTDLPPALESFLAAHKPALITVGLLEPEYDLASQIETLGAIRERLPNAGLVIVGSGSLEDDLRARIAAQPWAAHVLLCGDVPHGATLEAIHRADVFLRTTLYDGDSVAVREALHLGTPVVATDNGMRPEGVRLIGASDREALCRAVAECAAGAHPPVAAQSGCTDNIEAVLDVYRELIPLPRS